MKNNTVDLLTDLKFGRLCLADFSLPEDCDISLLSLGEDFYVFELFRLNLDDGRDVAGAVYDVICSFASEIGEPCAVVSSSCIGAVVGALSASGEHKCETVIGANANSIDFSPFCVGLSACVYSDVTAQADRLSAVEQAFDDYGYPLCSQLALAVLKSNKDNHKPLLVVVDANPIESANEIVAALGGEVSADRQMTEREFKLLTAFE